MDIDIKNLLDNIDEEVSCPVCGVILRDPKQLPCLHSYCLSCLEHLLRMGRRHNIITCPKCRVENKVPGRGKLNELPTSFRVKRLLDVLAIKECNTTGVECGSCGKRSTQTAQRFYCFQCRAFWCDDCITGHNIMQANKDHRVLALKDFQDKDFEDVFKRPGFCIKPRHENNELNFFCKICEVSICDTCASIYHEDHAKIRLEKTANETFLSKTKAHQSRVEGREICKVTAGLEVKIVLITRNAEGEQFYDERDQITVEARNRESDDCAIKARVQDNKDGSYKISFPFKETGKCDVSVKVNREHIPGSPFAVEVEAGHLGSKLSFEKQVDESSIVRATMKFEAEHEECLCVCPYLKNGEVVVHLYVYSDKYGIPKALETAAQEFFGDMDLKLEWSDLYNDAFNVLKVTPIKYPSGVPKRLKASQVDEIDKIIHNHLHIFSKHRNITAVQPSFKVKKLVQTEEPCIAVFVLGKGNIPVGESTIPCTIGSYPVDIVNGFWVRTNDPKDLIEAHEPKEVLRLGTSIGVVREQSSGTLGAVVEDVNSGILYALSCEHVMKHPDKSEIIHPGWDTYLNYLHHHLKQYREWIQRIVTEPECQLPEISVNILQEPEKLSERFNELKKIKEVYSTSERSSEDTLEDMRKHEKALEKGFSMPARIIAKYSAGIRCNVPSPDGKHGKEHFIDAAIAELKENEESNLKRVKTTKVVGTAYYPSGKCIPATTKATMNVDEFFKSGSGTGLTESSLLLGASISPPITLKEKIQQQGESAWMDVKCLTCDKREETQSQVQEPSSPCELCKPDGWLKSCLCIQKQGPKLFSDHGDSGAVIFEKDGDQISCPGLGIIFAVHQCAYFDFTIASPLEIALRVLSQKVSDSRPNSKPCELRLTSDFAKAAK